MTTLMSVRRHLLVGTRAVWKPVHWLALPAVGPVCTCCGFSCWRVFSNGPGFSEIFWCYCHPQCQICFGLGDGQDTEGFSNIGVSLGCSHYLYTKVCTQVTSGRDLCHVGTSKLISNKSMNWSLRDRIFIERSFWRLCYIIGAVRESILQSCVLA